MFHSSGLGPFLGILAQIIPALKRFRWWRAWYMDMNHCTVHPETASSARMHLKIVMHGSALQMWRILVNPLNSLMVTTCNLLRGCWRKPSMPAKTAFWFWVSWDLRVLESRPSWTTSSGADLAQAQAVAPRESMQQSWKLSIPPMTSWWYLTQRGFKVQKRMIKSLIARSHFFVWQFLISWSSTSRVIFICQWKDYWKFAWSHCMSWRRPRLAPLTSSFAPRSKHSRSTFFGMYYIVVWVLSALCCPLDLNVPTSC